MKATPRLLAILLLSSLAAPGVLASDWPGFRGLKGGQSDETDLPATLKSENILWKVKLPGAGTSSPVIIGDKLILTANAGYGTSISKGFGGGFGGKGKGGFPGKGGGDAGDQKKLKLLVLCIDRATGKTLWEKEVPPKLPETPFSGMMREHSYASSTPVTDGKSIFTFFGKSGVHAFDFDGKLLWSADAGSNVDTWGTAASPVLFEDLLIVNAAIESKSLIAFDKSSGKEVWRKSGLGRTWTTPIIAVSTEGRPELVVNLPGKIVAYDPKTGKELWTCTGVVGGGGGGFGGGKGGGFGGGYTASTPVARDGVVYVIGGGGPTPAAALAVKLGGSGDVNKTHVLWRAKAGASNCSPILSGDHLCFVDGTVTCLNIKDGEITYKERLYNGRNEYVSAVGAEGRIYALTRSDGLFVIQGGGKFEKISHLEFPGDASIFNASPAISSGRLYLRSNEYLYCIGKK